MPAQPAMFRLWDAGQRHLAAGRYVAARANLQAAERLAWRDRDAAALARIYLPLLETRRQIRYQAAEGDIFIAGEGFGKALPKEFLRTCANAGTLLLPAAGNDVDRAATQIHHAATRDGRCLEVLVFITHRGSTHLASPADAAHPAGLPVKWSSDPTVAIGPSTDPELIIPLPAPGIYSGAAAGLGAVARESLLIAWEALAMRWQRRHAARFRIPWDEIAWLRRALDVDPACEPVAMRLIAVAEAAGRGA